MNTGEEYNFRNAKWGMLKGKIMASESGPHIVLTGEQVGYFTKILEKK